MQGYVGGRPDLVGEAGTNLGVLGRRVGSVVPPYVSATRAGVDAVAEGPAVLAIVWCGAAWERALLTLAEQVEALGVVATDAGADLAAAGGS